MKTTFNMDFLMHGSGLGLRAHYEAGCYWLGSREWREELTNDDISHRYRSSYDTFLPHFLHAAPHHNFARSKVLYSFFHQERKWSVATDSLKNSAYLQWVSCIYHHHMSE